MAEYLRTGKRSDHDHTRDDKDYVIPVFGNLDVFEKSEKYLLKNKKYKYSYTHITCAFSINDMKKLYALPEVEKIKRYQEVAEAYIKHHSCGYDLENEVIAYAEVHEPKLKRWKGKHRLPHIHIGISHLNPLSNNQLKTTFAKNGTWMDDNLQNQINCRYGFDNPKNFMQKKKLKWSSEIGLTRKFLIEKFKDISSRLELVELLESKKINFREVETKRNNYLKIEIADGKNINIRGKGFEHIEEIFSGRKIEKAVKNEAYYSHFLDQYYEKRIQYIESRRSKKTKEKLKLIREQERLILNAVGKEPKSNTIFFDGVVNQKIIVYKIYKVELSFNLQGYYVDSSGEFLSFKNSKKRIEILDKGDSIEQRSSSDLSESIRLMLDIAEAKKWNLAAIKIEGKDEFRLEALKQIQKRLEVSSEIKLDLPSNKRACSSIDIDIQIAKEDQLFKKLDTRFLNSLQAKDVLALAAEQFNLDISRYEILPGNKIKNKELDNGNCSVVNFLRKELFLSFDEILKFSENVVEKKLIIENNLKKELKMAAKISICKDQNMNSLHKWEVVTTKNYDKLANYLCNHSYSASQFNGQRNSANATHFNNLLIFDVDNDDAKKNLSIKKAHDILEKKGVSALIIPTRSHGREKNGIVADRFRIVVPTVNALPDGTSKQQYRIYAKLCAEKLGLNEFVDKKAMNDIARFYYKSPKGSMHSIVNASQVFDNQQLILDSQIAFLNLQQSNEIIKSTRARIRINPPEPYVPMRVRNTLSYVDTDLMLSINISDLIEQLQPNQVTKEGNYKILKTEKEKFSILHDENLAHDFKSGKTFNVISYLENFYNLKNLNRIARRLKVDTGIDCVAANVPAIDWALNYALKTSKNVRELENALKSSFGVDFCSLKDEYIRIADVSVKLSEFELSMYDIVGEFMRNRGEDEHGLEPKLD